MRRAPITLRHPRAALAVAFVVIAALGIAGLGVEGKLRPTSIAIPGTESARSVDRLRPKPGKALILVDFPPPRRRC